jgi:hypothetical protein
MKALRRAALLAGGVTLTALVAAGYLATGAQAGWENLWSLCAPAR